MSQPLLTPEVAVVVHPLAAEAHLGDRGGWRWAVHVGGQSPSDLQYCANAGRATTRQMAALIGESHGAAACKALRILGLPAAYRGVVWLDADPIPAGVDQPLGTWLDDQTVQEG
jgi:hypothetical protein